jgi:hypothetical protein
MPINEKPTELQGGPEKPAELQGSPPPVHEVVLGDPNSTPATVRSPADVPSPHDLSQR